MLTLQNHGPTLAKSLVLTVALALVFTAASNAQQMGGSLEYRPYSSTQNGGFGGHESTCFAGGFSSVARPNNIGKNNASPSSYNASPSTYNASPSRYNAGRSNSSGSTMQQLEQAINQIDTPQVWNKTPVAALPVRSSSVPTGMLSRRQVMRTFLEQDSSLASPATPASNSTGAAAAASQTYSYYQTAATQEQRAYSYGQYAKYDTDSWSRNKAASTSEYAARAAESATDSAYRASQYGDSQARSYAAQARSAANRARASANRARWDAAKPS